MIGGEGLTLFCASRRLGKRVEYAQRQAESSVKRGWRSERERKREKRPPALGGLAEFRIRVGGLRILIAHAVRAPPRHA